MEKESEYLVVLPIDPISKGVTYEPGQPLPLHCTLMHWFWLKGKSAKRHLGNELMLQASRIEKGHIKLVSKEPALFGPNNDVPVHVLERNEELNLLHTRLLVFLAGIGAELTQLQWIGAGYRPHATVVGGASFAPGTTYRAKHLALVRRLADKSKVVVQEEQLGGIPF